VSRQKIRASQAGRLIISFCSVSNTGGAVSEAYSSILKTLIREADCYHTITISTIPDCMIFIDPLRLSQVIANIIYNSYKYANTPITIDFEIKDDYLEMQIQDYGKGVEEEELPLLFNKFYRGKNAATESGSGLGLYICKKLIEQMEGEIYCNNNVQGFETHLFLRLV
jgi:signal transduction histidine kinase